MTRLAILILNYRTPELTIQCLDSLAPEVATVPGCRAVVIDNASGDGSPQAIAAAIAQRGWSNWAQLHVMERNGGFAWGNNRGWECCSDADYALLLNSDTIVHAGCLEHCLKVMEADHTIGALSCRVLNADGSIQNVTRRFPTPLRALVAALGLPWKLPRLFGWADIQAPRWDRTRAMDVDWIGGAFMLIRGEVIRRIGLLDEDFFFYGEDIEFCHRVWRAGWRVRYDPGASITHLAGSSSDPARAPDLQREKQRWTARYLVQRKCYGRAAEWFVRAIDWLGLTIRLLVLRLLGRHDHERYQNLAAALAARRLA